ncbi:HD-GYP domain-containing protein [Motilimonas sp. KMU-193]|uniref:HD-GYP domain-containing protein n=1 Tax=Motilimonas sp. KMU-193 TaxID=3388668 RepID=UPI00396AFB47
MKLANMAENKVKKSPVAINDLAIGHFVELPLGWKDHPFMFNSFKIKNQEQLTIIQALGLSQVDVDWQKSDVKPITPAQSENPPEQPVKKVVRELTEEEKQRAISKQLRMDNKRADAAYHHSLLKFREAMGQFGLAPEEALVEIKTLITALCADVYASPTTKVMHVIQAQPSSDDLFYHSLNVTVLCLVAAKALEWSETEAQTLCLSAFLHDIGLLKVPTSIRRKTTPLTTSEDNFYKMHTTYGVELIKKANCFPSEVLPLIAQHHERLDGSGYPKQVKANQLDEMTQLLGLVDAYDNLCFPHPSQKALSPRSAIALMFKQSETKFNRSMLEVLVKLLGVYPPGSLVQLDDNTPALVMSTNPEDAMNPNVLIYEVGKNQSTGLVIPLAKHERNISRVLSFEDLDELATRYFNNHIRYCLYFSPRVASAESPLPG